MSDLLLTIFLPISSLLISTYALLLWIIRILGFVRRLPNSAIILPPAAPGSLGDEAMVCASIDYLSQQGIENISLIEHTHKQTYPVDVIENINVRNFFMYQSWYKFIASFIYVGWKVNQYERFYALGADVMDGYYSNYYTFKTVKIAEIASFIGCSTGILGFSCNRQPTNISKQLLSALPSSVRLNARDKISYQRLIDSIYHPINLVADLAFLLKPVEQSDKLARVLEWVNSQKSQNKIVLGINIHILLLKKLEGITANDLVQVLAETITKLHQDNSQLSFIFLPHDRRKINGFNDNFLSKKVIESLPSEVASSCFKIPFPCLAREIKAIVKHIDCVLTGRMHLGIACLGQGTPIACITYQGKFQGLYQHFNLEPLFIEPKKLFVPNQNELVELVHKLIEQRQSLHEQIISKLDDVKELSQANFTSII
ncbi:MAG: polysaccharide pyruvyl transferase family protein [Trichodesmium sp. MO_231.B1]|nr:polysaccharide pyruvyl transferase family protein [Trichodesmium sp. MO_231.B1]